MALADGLVVEHFPFAGAVQVRGHAGIGDQKHEAGDREEEGRR